MGGGGEKWRVLYGECNKICRTFVVKKDHVPRKEKLEEVEKGKEKKSC